MTPFRRPYQKHPSCAPAHNPIITQASNYFVLLVIPNSIMLYTFMDPLFTCMDPILEMIEL